MTLIPNQPFPDLPSWEDLSPILINGWDTPGSAQSLQGIGYQNTVDIFGRVQIGSHQIIGILPQHLQAASSYSVPALILGGPSCLVEVQGGYRLLMSAFSLGMTDAQMIATYQGKYLSIVGSFPRRIVA